MAWNTQTRQIKKKKFNFISEGNKPKKNEKGKLFSNQNKKACQ